MKCHNCGADLENKITDIPFKTNDTNVIIIKKLPVQQCKNCNEYLIEDKVMQKVDAFLKKSDKTAELEVLSYAV